MGIHLGNVSFPVGKVDVLNLYFLTFEEFLLAVDGDRYVDLLRDFVRTLQSTENPRSDLRIPTTVHEYLWNQLKNFFVIGDLPEVVNTYVENRNDFFTAIKTVRLKQEQLIISYTADMAKHIGKVNAMHIDRVWKAVPAQLAKSRDGSAHKFKFKGVIRSESVRSLGLSH